MPSDARHSANGTVSSPSLAGSPRPSRRFARVNLPRGEERVGNLFDPHESDATVRHLRRG